MRARFRPCGGRLGRDVEQQRRNAGVGEVRGDLGAHHAGAEHRDGTNHRLSLPVVGPSGSRDGPRRLRGWSSRLRGWSKQASRSVQVGLSTVGPEAGAGGASRTVEGRSKRLRGSVQQLTLVGARGTVDGRSKGASRSVRIGLSKVGSKEASRAVQVGLSTVGPSRLRGRCKSDCRRSVQGGFAVGANRTVEGRSKEASRAVQVGLSVVGPSRLRGRCKSDCRRSVQGGFAVGARATVEGRFNGRRRQCEQSEDRRSSS